MKTEEEPSSLFDCVTVAMRMIPSPFKSINRSHFIASLLPPLLNGNIIAKPIDIDRLTSAVVELARTRSERPAAMVP